jgi:hypothetical protein
MGTLQKLKAKTVLNAEKTQRESVKNPSKPNKLEDKRQSGFAPTSVSCKYPGSIGGMTIPVNRRRKHK